MRELFKKWNKLYEICRDQKTKSITMEDISKKTLKQKAEEMSNDSEAEQETLKQTLKLEAESVAATKEDNEAATTATTSTSNISQI